MKFLVVLLGLVLGGSFASYAVPRVQVQLSVEPATRALTCQYMFMLPAGDTTSVLRLNLRKDFRMQLVPSGRAAAQVRHIFYPYFNDTVQQVWCATPPVVARPAP